MALFVAKLLDTHSFPSAELETREVSPSHRRGEPFESKLARCLKRREARQPVSDEFKQELSQVLLAGPRLHAESVQWPPGVVEVLRKRPLREGVDLQTAIGETIAQLTSQLEEAERQVAMANEQEIRERASLVATAKRSLAEAAKAQHDLLALVHDISAIESELKSNQAMIDKGRFLEAVSLCITMTDELHTVPLTQYVEHGDLFLSKLREVDQLRPLLEGRCREVVESRFAILTDSFTTELTEIIRHSESPDRATAYRLLSQFSHPDPYKAVSLFLNIKMEKLEYHFVRPESALNLLDKPEWPLRWFLDTAVETCNLIEDKDHVGRYIARAARDYFRRHRWSLVKSVEDPDEGELFSLYLAKYIHSANQWKDVFSVAVLEEFMLDVTENAQVGPWRLLDAWIAHDRRHIQAALESTANPFSPSKHNPLVCNLILALEDVLDSSRARLECIKHRRSALLEFTRECHDPVMEDFMYNVKVATREMNPQMIEFVKQSLVDLKTKVDESDLISLNARRQLAELIRHI